MKKTNETSNQKEIEFYTNEFVVDDAEVDTDMSSDMHVAKQIKDFKTPNHNAWASFALGIASSLAWIIPVAGVPITIVGTVLGAVSMKRKRNRGIGIAGFVINIIFLCCGIAKGIVDLVLYLKAKERVQ